MAAELLAFEARWPRLSPEKRHAIRHELGMHEARYFQLLIRAASSEDGIRADPLTARRVREQVERRASIRERRAA